MKIYYEDKETREGRNQRRNARRNEEEKKKGRPYAGDSNKDGEIYEDSTKE